MNTAKPRIGLIGQGWIGKNYANDFEKRGFETVRYSLEEEYKANKDKLPACDIIFIAVPTPTTPQGFDAHIVEDALLLVGKDQIAVIKSTILPGTAAALQEKYKDPIILYSPEFLSVATAEHDVSFPFSSIVGFTKDTPEHRLAAEQVMKVLPKAPFTLTCTSTEAEIIKYSHNANGYFQIIFFNMMYDLAQKLGGDWELIQKAIDADPYISSHYTQPVHKSGRGAGGGCFIKDFAALRELFQKTFPHDAAGLNVLQSLEKKNIELLKSTNKDPDLLSGVYGA